METNMFNVFQAENLATTEHPRRLDGVFKTTNVDGGEVV